MNSVKSQVGIMDFILSNKKALLTALVAVFVVLLVIFSVFGWSINALAGLALAGLLAYFLIKTPLYSLFALVTVRMFLDYPSERVTLSLFNAYSLSLSQGLGIVIFLAGVIYLIKNFKSLKNVPLKIPIFAYFTFAVMTLIYTIDSFSTAKEILRLFDLIFLFVISFNEVRTRKTYEQLLKVILFSALATAVIGVFQYVLGIGYTDAAFGAPRIFGTFSHPNSFSLYLLAVLAAVFIYFFTTKNIKSKVFSSSVIPLFLLIILLTYTRAAWVAVLVLLLTIGVMRYRKFLVILLTSIIMIYSFSPLVQERVMEATSSSPTNSFAWRKTLWKDSIGEVFTEGRQIAGYGTNTFEIVLENKRGNKFGSNAAHNDYVRSFTEGGYIGLAIFLIYLSYMMVYLINRYRKSSESDNKVVMLILFALLLSMSVASLTDNIMRNTPLQWIFWILMGASLRVFNQK